MRDALDTPSLALRMALHSHRGVADNDSVGEGALRGLNKRDLLHTAGIGGKPYAMVSMSHGRFRRNTYRN